MDAERKVKCAVLEIVEALGVAIPKDIEREAGVGAERKVKEAFETTVQGAHDYAGTEVAVCPRIILDKFQVGDRVRVTVERLAKRKEKKG